MTKRKMAELLNDSHPEWCYATCRNRIDAWLKMAEFMLYLPMRDAFSSGDLKPSVDSICYPGLYSQHASKIWRRD
ncbi:DUF1133 family protein [Escherichia coli]|nr:DUF1133 family protein [Escherichia coli]